MLWYVKSRKDLLFLDTTDRVPVRTVEVAAHIREAIVKEEDVGAVAVRSGRPVEAEAASIVGKAVAAATVAGSREERLRGIIKICIITT